MPENNNVQARFNQAVQDYLLWMIDRDYSSSTWNFYERLLLRFGSYISGRDLPWESIFTRKTLRDFGSECKLVQFQSPIRGLGRYLYKQQKISKSMDRRKEVALPARYHEYLVYYEKTHQVCRRQVLNSERILVLFAEWLTGNKLELKNLCIEHLDAFQVEISNRYAPETRRRHRTVLRGLLGWLYQQKVIRRNLSPLLVGAPQYAKAIPPKFLRPEELQKLFAINPQTASEYRTRAMLYLACSLGLRPKEISLISLDDINFARQEIRLPQRKSANPISIPLPLVTIRAIEVCAYLLIISYKQGRKATAVGSFCNCMPRINRSIVCRSVKALTAGCANPAYRVQPTGCVIPTPRTSLRQGDQSVQSGICLAMTISKQPADIFKYTLK